MFTYFTQKTTETEIEDTLHAHMLTHTHTNLFYFVVRMLLNGHTCPENGNR